MTDAASGAVQRLNALLAGLNELPTSLQGPTLRQYLEYGLDRLQRLEEENLTFLGECAVLAGENLQDIRVRDLEQKVERIENPAARSWGETLLSVVSDIAMQLAMLQALEGLATVTIAYLAQRAIGAAVRETVWSVGPKSRRQTLLAQEATLANSRRNTETALSALPDVLKVVLDGGAAKLPDGRIELHIDVGETRSIASTNDWMKVSRELSLRRERIRSELVLARQAVFGDDDNVLTAYHNAWDSAGQDAIAKYSSVWRDFVGGERGGLAMNPMRSLLEQALAALEKPAKGQAPGPFLTSTTIGRFLSFAANQRLEVGEAYAALKAYVRYATDDALKTDERIAALAQMITELLPQLEQLRMLAVTVRPSIVLGFEAAFWFEYLRANGALEVQSSVTYTAGPNLEVGSYVDGFIIRSPAQVSVSNPQWAEFPAIMGLPFLKLSLWLHQYQADFYCGVRVLGEAQTETLYHRFAKPFFRVEENRKLAALPFAYVETDYDLLLAEQPRLWEGRLTSQEYRQRLDEMRLLVILFFLNFRTGTPDSRLDAILGAGASASVVQWVSELSTGVVPDLSDSNEATQRALDASRAPLQALLSAVGIGQSPELRDATLAFGQSLIDLNQDILAFQFMDSRKMEASEEASGRSAEELLKEIEYEKRSLQQQYDALLSMAAEDGSASSMIESNYGETVTAITAWTPKVLWRWHGAAP